MGIWVFLVTIILLGLSFFIFHNRPLHPIILFLELWSFILFLSVLNLYEIYKPSDKAYFLLLIMIICFFVGGICTRFSVKISRNKVQYKRFRGKDSHVYLFYIITALFIAFMCFDCYLVINQLLNGVSFLQIRFWAFEVTGSDNPILSRRSFIEEIFRTLVLTPFGTLIPPFTAYYFFHPKKYKKRYLMVLLSILILVLSSISDGGGRLQMIYYFGCFLLAYFTFSSKKLFENFNKRKYQIVICMIVVIGLLSMIVLTRFRVGTGYLVKQIYTYFALSPTLLSVWLPNLEEASSTYGLLSFFGVHSYFFRVFQTLGLDYLVPQIYETVYQHVLNAGMFKQVGFGVGNSFVSPVYYFYLDGGYTFVAGASFCFGNCVSRFYNKFSKEINIRSYTFYALIMYGVFLSFIRIQTSIPTYIMSFVFARFLLPSKNK